MSVVYFVYDGEFTKIGITTVDVRVRMAALQTPKELECLGTLPGGRELEERLHTIFAKRRVRGEWFKGRIEPPEAEAAISLEDKRECAVLERIDEKFAEICEWARRSEALAQWLAAHTDKQVPAEVDWSSPFLQINYVPVLDFFDACAEAGIDPSAAMQASQ